MKLTAQPYFIIIAWLLIALSHQSSQSVKNNNKNLQRWQTSDYLLLLSHFLPFKVHLTNILPILILKNDFKKMVWATSFATWESRKFIYLPIRASGKKVIVIP